MRVHTLYSTKEIVTEQGRRMELRYYLVQDLRAGIKRRQNIIFHETEQITYGIRIVKTESGIEEQECIPGLSESMEMVERLLRQMIHGVVTPMDAAAVTDDWMSEIQMAE